MVEKRVKKFGQGPPSPLFGQCLKENIFFQEGFPYLNRLQGSHFFLIFCSWEKLSPQ